MSRLANLIRFYDVLGELERRVGGNETLAEFGARAAWPERGIYFFYEPGETRHESGAGLRVVRVGTHALTSGSRSTLRQRLAQHRGLGSGAGNHRSSIFRLLIGQSLLAQGSLAPCLSWGLKSDPTAAAGALGMERASLLRAEEPVERAVSGRIRAMPFLWLGIGDEPGPESYRGIIERNAIALLSNFGRAPLDPPSSTWLGRSCNRLQVRDSGLWNQRHVEDAYDPAFLDIMEQSISGADVTR
jgi:hypothetical protein